MYYKIFWQGGKSPEEPCHIGIVPIIGPPNYIGYYAKTIEAQTVVKHKFQKTGVYVDIIYYSETGIPVPTTSFFCKSIEDALKEIRKFASTLGGQSATEEKKTRKHAVGGA